MLIPVPELIKFFGVHPNGVLHVGAHDAEEAIDYSKHKWGSVIWVEMLPEKYEALRARFANDTQNRVLHAACWDTDGVRLPIFRASNGQSSSLLPPEQVLTKYPSISFAKDAEITTSRLDSILPIGSRFDFINLDIQGAELRALRGLGARLADVKWAYLEVNMLRLYEDCALVGEIDAFMGSSGFVRIATRTAGSAGWGDALYTNTRKMPKLALWWLMTKAAAWRLRYESLPRLRTTLTDSARRIERALRG
jgi:FkbM family methyltransferase